MSMTSQPHPLTNRQTDWSNYLENSIFEFCTPKLLLDPLIVSKARSRPLEREKRPRKVKGDCDVTKNQMVCIIIPNATTRVNTHFMFHRNWNREFLKKATKNVHAQNNNRNVPYNFYMRTFFPVARGHAKQKINFIWPNKVFLNFGYFGDNFQNFL